MSTATTETTTTDDGPVTYPKHPFIVDDAGDCAYCGGCVVEDDERHEEPFERNMEECLDDLKEQTVEAHPFIENPDDTETCLSCNQGRDFGAHPEPDGSVPETPPPFIRAEPLTLSQALSAVTARETAAAEARRALTVAKGISKGADELLASALQALREAAQREVEQELPFAEDVE